MIALLATVTATGPFAMQVFLPALPAIQQSFGVSPGIAQLTLSLSMIAIALATLIYGPVSDRLGRRPTMLAGMALFGLGSIGCALATSIEGLIIARVVQAAGGAAGMVLARAIAHDRFGAAGATSVIAQLTMVMVVAPMIAPAVGGTLSDLFDWRATFWLSTGLGGVVLVWCFSQLSESRPESAGTDGWLAVFRGAPLLFKSRRYCAFALQAALMSTIFFSFVSGAPYLMIGVLNRPATEYGFYFIVVSGGFMLGNFLAMRVSGVLSQGRTLVTGAAIALSGVAVMVICTAVGLLSIWTLFLPMMVTSVGSGLVMPNAQAAAINEFPHRAGTASGVSGFLQMILAACATQLVGVLQNGTAWPMLACMSFSAVGACLAVWIGLTTPKAEAVS